MNSWQPLGKHLIRITEDVVFVSAQGEVTGDEALGLFEHLSRLQQKYGWAFQIFDARGATDMSAEARRQTIDWYHHNRLDFDAVVFGVRQAMATQFALMVNAFRLLGGNDVTLHIVGTEDEAEAWVAARRQEKRAARSAK